MRNSKKLKEESCSRVHKLDDNKHEENVGEEDIISHLPEHILHHIFSFVEIKHTIQTTSLLSKRWRYFWCSLPTLKFTYNADGTNGNRKTDFLDFVDRVFVLRDSSNIHGFILYNNSYRSIGGTNRLNTWILALVRRNVQELTLDTHFPAKFRFHQCLFTSKSLTKLVVKAVLDRHASLGLPDSISLPRLKTLSLSSVKFEDEKSTNQLFSSCPILESLTLRWCEFPPINVKISSPNLQHLVIDDCTTIRSNALDLGETNFQLCAPNLISFLWSNDMSIHCAPNNLSTLVKADIHTDLVYHQEKKTVREEKKAMYAQSMVNILRLLHNNVEDLKLTAAFLEVITGAPYLLDSQPMQFCNLRCLKLSGDWRSVDCIHAISYLLNISPNIETLSVGVQYWAPGLLEVQPTQCCNLRCLKMKAWLSRDCIYAIAYFLKISPKMENLSLSLYVSSSNDKTNQYLNPDEVTSNSAKRGDCWKAGLSLEGLLNHVKCFELRNVTGRINELEFIEILLKNAIQLEELLIFFYICPFAKEKELEERRLLKFSEKVLTFPKASSNVVIMFKYGK